MTQQRIAGFVVLVVFVAAALVAADIIARNMVWNDTVGRHIGCRAFFNRISPYAEQVNQAIAAQNPDPELEQRFYNPAHICLILLPFWLLPYDISLRLWVALLLMVFVALPPLLMVQVFHWRLKRWQLLLVLIVLILGFRYSMMTIVLGQYTGFAMLCITGSLVALVFRRPLLAAICLVGLTIRPDATLIAAGIGLLTLYKREWRVIILTIVIGIGVLIGSLVFVGNWIPAFLDDVTYYAGAYNSVRWLPHLLPSPLDMGLVLLVLFAAGIVLFRLRFASSDVEYYFIGGSVFVLLSLLLLPQTNPYTLVFAVPVICWLLFRLRSLPGIWWGFAAFVGVLPWVLFRGGRAWAHVDQLVFPLLWGILLLMVQRVKPKTDT